MNVRRRITAPPPRTPAEQQTLRIAEMSERITQLEAKIAEQAADMQRMVAVLAMLSVSAKQSVDAAIMASASLEGETDSHTRLTALQDWVAVLAMTAKPIPPVFENDALQAAYEEHAY